MDLHQQRKHELTCPVCKSKYKEPKVLPCLHSSCYECLKKLASFGHSFRCYVCMEEVDHRTIASLPDDFVAKSATDMLILTSDGEDESVTCNSCEKGPPALGRCLNCQDFLCQICINAHALTKLTRDHKVYRFNMNADMNKNYSPRCPDSRMVKCSIHTVDDVKYFCVSCEKAVCSECLIQKHRDHQLASIEEYGNKQRSKLAVKVMKSENKMKQIEEGLEHIRYLSNSIQLNAENARTNVTDHIMRCRKKLDAAEEALLREIDYTVRKKHASLQQQGNELEEILQKFTTACSFSAKVLQNSNEAELMLLQAHIDLRLKTLGGIQPELHARNDDVISYNYSEEDLRKFGDGCFGEIRS